MIEIFYIIGGIIAAIMIVYYILQEDKSDITVLGLCALILVALSAALFSWASIIVILVFRYRDKIIIKRE